jgi:hypothetical protein
VRKVQRSEILDYATYNDQRDAVRSTVMDVKRRRRVHVGPCLTFLFENASTIWYQIQEMMRIERIVRESDIRQEIDTYNALLGDAGQLGCSMLIEIDDVLERQRRLRQWRGLPGYVYFRCEGGATVRPAFDPRQDDGERISAVQYLRFSFGDWRPLALGCDFPGLQAETVLNQEQRDALNEDLIEENATAAPVARGHHVVVPHQPEPPSGR